MPLNNTFKCKSDFIAVFSHEVVHSTGHTDRLDRKAFNIDSKSFSDKDYA